MVGPRLARRRRKIFEAFRTLSATSSTTARTLFEIGIKDSHLFRAQVRRKIIVQVQENRFYLDEVREEEMHRLRHTILAGVIIVSIIVLLIAVSSRF